jgi:hypothetical protein
MATKYESKDVPLEDWVEDGVSYLQAEVTIYRDPGMFAKYGPLMEKIRILEDARKPKKEKRERGLEEEAIGGEQEAVFTDESLSDSVRAEVDQELEKARAEAEKLWETYSKNTEVWTIRRLNEDEVVAIREDIGEIPEQPAKLSTTKASQRMREAWADKMVEWSKEMDKFNRELHTRCLAEAVVQVKVRGRKVKKPDVEMIRRLQKRPGGDAHFKELKEALLGLTMEGVEIMAPHREGTGA